MTKLQATELFMPPNALKDKVGGTGLGIDTAAIRRAEAAIDDIKSSFPDWLKKDIAALVDARAAYLADRTADNSGRLFRASHDIKGQAATFDYPLVARIAASLCRLLETASAPDAVQLPLIDVHVNAISASYRDGVKDASDITALRLIEELESKVRTVVERAAAAAEQY
jgi:hypothetical protein